MKNWPHVDRAVSIQPFPADHLQFRTEEERSMRIDQQQRMMPSRIRRRDRYPVRPSRLLDSSNSRPRRSEPCRIAAPIKRLQLIQIDALDIPADTALA